ncbi:hypothetical protein ADZ36_05190 [Streptomyces fradiae]|uniref:Uncharacterized protein n=1 Tax=Streptomyces fradiae TaxID=1906 RepID=A0ACC4WFU4_STRFR|nr:hypothetical protein ADZ36_05190 [Streptomyces fradiae]OFA61956.1 hypothetical protein BEN35_00560 [Streptomyces fradiae]
MAASERPGSRSRSAASVSRRPVRYDMGGSPTSPVKRRARTARETPAADASDATVHASPGRSCSCRRARPTTGSLPARNQSGAPLPGSVSQERRNVDEQQVQEPVEDHLLADVLLVQLGGQHADQRGPRRRGGLDQQRRQAGEQPAPDLAGCLVGAAEHHRRSRAVWLAPGAHPQRHRLGDVLPVAGVAALVRADGDVRPCRRVVDERVRLGAAQHRHVPGLQPHRGGVLAESCRCGGRR